MIKVDLKAVKTKVKLLHRSSLQASLDPEENLEFQVRLDRVLMEPEGKMVSQGVLELKASLVRY